MCSMYTNHKALLPCQWFVRVAQLPVYVTVLCIENIGRTLFKNQQKQQLETVQMFSITLWILPVGR